MHESYPAAFRNALASDAYWQVAPENVTLTSMNGFVPDVTVLTERSELIRDQEAARRLTSLVSAVGPGVDTDTLPWGERIPDMHGRQFAIVVEDGRRIVDRFSLENMARLGVNAVNRRRIDRIAPGYAPPTLEDQLKNFYDDNSPSLAFSIEADVARSRPQTALISRRILFMMRNDAGKLVATDGLLALITDLPEIWKRVSLREIPDLPIGTPYSKGRAGRIDHLGKITTARVLELQKVAWKQNKKGDDSSKRRERKQALNGVPAFAKLALEA